MRIRAFPVKRAIALLVLLAVIAAAYVHLAGYVAWRRALREAGFVDELAPPDDDDRVLVIAPHPDDEALGCGGLIQQAVGRGAHVWVVVMTNGDGAEWSVLLGERDLRLSPEAFIRLGRQRREESLEALRMLGVPAKQTDFLGFPNAGLVPMWRPEHWEHGRPYRSPHTGSAAAPYERVLTPRAPYCGQQVLSDLIQVLEHVKPTMVFVPHPQDVHPDHWATYCFARYGLATVAVRGGDWARRTRVYGYLVHWPGFPVPKRRAPKLDLLPPRDLSGPSSRWFTLPLTAEQTKRKADAIRQYRSQAPRFTPLLLALAKGNEVFEELPIVSAARGEITSRDPPQTRSRLAGAKVTSLRITGLDGPQASALVTGAPKAMPKGAYIALDIRTWDDYRSPAITTVYLRNGGDAQVYALGPGLEPQQGSVEVWAPQAGVFEVSRVPLLAPRGREQDVFITCWGSIGDRLTDPAMAAWVSVPLPRVGPAVDHDDAREEGRYH